MWFHTQCSLLIPEQRKMHIHHQNIQLGFANIVNNSNKNIFGKCSTSVLLYRLLTSTVSNQWNWTLKCLERKIQIPPNQVFEPVGQERTEIIGSSNTPLVLGGYMSCKWRKRSNGENVNRRSLSIATSQKGPGTDRKSVV